MEKYADIYGKCRKEKFSFEKREKTDGEKVTAKSLDVCVLRRKAWMWPKVLASEYY